MDAGARQYIDGIATEHRPLFDRVDRLIREVFPDVGVALSYQLPTYRVGKRRLHVGAWQHGISIYGWGDRDAGFGSRHPTLISGKGTLRLTTQDAAAVTNDELREFLRAALTA